MSIGSIHVNATKALASKAEPSPQTATASVRQDLWVVHLAEDLDLEEDACLSCKNT
jgi:hypothetical protein